MSDTSQVMQSNNLVLCSHLEGAKKAKLAYRPLTIGDKHFLLCRACYGEVMTQVLDDLRKIEVRVR